MVFPNHPTPLFIPGPVGRLEAQTTWPKDNSPHAVGILCHPHPLFQGTMNNKVVTTMVKTFEELGLATVRFNFRGVGQSDGIYGEAEGEIEDLRSVIAWVKNNLPQLPIWLAGFSFGSFIAAAVANNVSDETQITQLVSIAPPVNHFPFQTLTQIHCPWLVLQGTEDEVVPFDLVKQWAEHPPSPLKFIELPGVSHFFHGKLSALKEILINELKK